MTKHKHLFQPTRFHMQHVWGGGHRVLHREGERVEVRELTPVAFILSDQNFPPSLPVEMEGECLKVMRVEDGTLQELVTTFLEATRGFVVPAGSVVAIASASHLAWVGAAAYAQELVNAIHRLRAAFRGGDRGGPWRAIPGGWRPRLQQRVGNHGLVSLAHSH
jgi:hypothetical protein